MHDKSVTLQTVSKFNTFLDLISQNCMLSVLEIQAVLFSDLQAAMVYFACIWVNGRHSVWRLEHIWSYLRS